MRLRYMEKLLTESIKRFNISGSPHPQNPQLAVVTGIPQTIDAIRSLEGLNFLKNDIENLKRIPLIFNSRIDEPINVSVSNWNDFTATLNQIRFKIDSVIQASQQVIERQDENSISIKLPNTVSLSEISDYIKEINKALEQAIVNPEIKGKVEIKNVDAGSIWFDIYVGSQLAVLLIGSLAWAAAVIRKKYYESDLLKELVETQSIKNDALDAVNKGMKEIIAINCEAEARNALKELGVKDNDNEWISRLKHTIQMFSSLIDKGAEIHPALIAPEKVTNLFPDFSKLDLIESRTKLLAAPQEESAPSAEEPKTELESE